MGLDIHGKVSEKTYHSGYSGLIRDVIDASLDMRKMTIQSKKNLDLSSVPTAIVNVFDSAWKKLVDHREGQS